MYGRWAKALLAAVCDRDAAGYDRALSRVARLQRCQGSRSTRSLARGSAGGVRGLRVDDVVADCEGDHLPRGPGSGPSGWPFGRSCSWCTSGPRVRSGTWWQPVRWPFSRSLPEVPRHSEFWRCGRSPRCWLRFPRARRAGPRRSRLADAGAWRTYGRRLPLVQLGALERPLRHPAPPLQHRLPGSADRAYSRTDLQLAAVPRNFMNYWLGPTVERSALISMGALWQNLAGRDCGDSIRLLRAHASVRQRPPVFWSFSSPGWWSPYGPCAGIREPCSSSDACSLATVPLLAYLALCHRYMHDLYPALAGGACIAAGRDSRDWAENLCPVRDGSGRPVVVLGVRDVRADLGLPARPDVGHAGGAPQPVIENRESTSDEIFTPSRFTAVDPVALPRTEPAGRRLRVFDCDREGMAPHPEAVQGGTRSARFRGTAGSAGAAGHDWRASITRR